MDWLKKHTDTVIIIGAVASAASSMLWVNTKFNEIDRSFSDIEREIAIVKRVLVMKNVMPAELATKKECDK